MRTFSHFLAAVVLALFACAVLPAESRATDDEKYSLEQLDRAHDIITGMHPMDRGALYRRAADAELTAEELFLDEEARLKSILGEIGSISGGTLGTISATPNIPEEEPAVRGNKRGKR